MYRFAALLLFSGFSLTLTAQDQTTQKVSRRPDIPGNFVLEYGFNRDLSGPDTLGLGFLGSRSVNVYYQYSFRILKSKFSFVPGIGLSLERFKIKDDLLVAYDPNDQSSILLNSPVNAVPGIKKSMLITNYIDVPLEIQYSTNPDDPARSFKISVGGRIGFMFDSFNKIKYKENGESKKLKNKQDFNLNKLRYGLSARIGVGNFSLFGYYNLSPLFKEGKGLSDRIDKTTTVKNDFSTLTVGISLASF
jgi:hypothetical protein